MACACRVAQDLSALQNSYGIGPKGKNNKNGSTVSMRLILRSIVVWCILIISIPILLVVTAVNAINGKKPVKIDRLFRLKRA